MRDDNIEKLSKRVAQYVNRPRNVGLDDARQDAAIVLIKMRDSWKPERAAHLSADRCERLAVQWARLRLIDQYYPEFVRQKQTLNFQTGNDNDAIFKEIKAYPQHFTADGVVDPKSEKRLSDLDNQEIGDLINRLTDKQRVVMRLLMFDGLTQVEVGKRLGVSQTAISTTFERAMEALRVLLHDYQHES